MNTSLVDRVVAQASRPGVGTRCVRVLVAVAVGCVVLPCVPLASPAAAQELTESRRVTLARRLQVSTVSVVAGPSTGSGFVAGPERWIVTNAHVVEGGGGVGGHVQVRFGSGTTRQATILEVDPSHDLSILEIRGAIPSPPLELGDSDRVEVGQTVLAFGSPFGLDGTLTEGIVSARRDVPGIGGGMAHRLIQTDAPINPGNSGGPLVDRRGHVVGVNTAILSRTGGSHGIGFAVPSNYVLQVLARVRDARRVRDTTSRAAGGSDVGESHPDNASSSVVRSPADVPPPPFFGVVVQAWAAEGAQGVVVRRTEPGSPAQQAGILGAADAPPPAVSRLRIPWNGHIITAVDGVNVRTPEEFERVVGARTVGQRVRVSVTLGAGLLSGDTTVTLAARPPATP